MADDSSVSVAPAGEVFISYSWDSDEHIKAVREFGDRLRSEGIDAIIDQYEESPPDGWPRWMEKKIRDSRLVLLVCTEEYYKEVMGEAAPKTRLGVRWEGGLIYQHLYNDGTNQKFIPVLFRDVANRKASNQLCLLSPLIRKTAGTITAIKQIISQVNRLTPLSKLVS